jgi:hypothetical protein
MFCFYALCIDLGNATRATTRLSMRANRVLFSACRLITQSAAEDNPMPLSINLIYEHREDQMADQQKNNQGGQTGGQQGGGQQSGGQQGGGQQGGGQKGGGQQGGGQQGGGQGGR